MGAIGRMFFMAQTGVVYAAALVQSAFIIFLMIDGRNTEMLARSDWSPHKTLQRIPFACGWNDRETQRH
jgi:hypothetical protein